MRVGVHLSIQGGVDKAVDRAIEKSCNTFQIFTRNPRAWNVKELESDIINSFKEKIGSFDLYPVVDHMPYLVNLASPKDEVYSKSLYTLKTELKRCGQLNIPFLVTHLGSHLGSGLKNGFIRIVRSINEALSEVKNDVILLLENTSGTRNSIGKNFQEIKWIINNILYGERVGLCFDTSHAFAAGYDLSNQKNVEYIMEELNEQIGFSKLKIVHLNDSKSELGCGLDRHEHIGLGKIGVHGFKAILKHRVMRNLPFILETPVDSRRNDCDNIEEVRKLYTR